MRGSSTEFGYVPKAGGCCKARMIKVSPLPSQLATHPLALVIHSLGTVDTIIGIPSAWRPAYNDAMGKLDRFQTDQVLDLGSTPSLFHCPSTGAWVVGYSVPKSDLSASSSMH